jgi:MoxR-like ATPase
MKKTSLAEFVINEAGRGRPRKQTEADINPDAVVGKDAEHNGSQGKWAIEEPTDNDAMTPLTAEEKTENVKKLMYKFKTRRPFFILGKAGWGKTSLIKRLAKRSGLSIITVYLDKCEAADLEGIKVPVKNSKGHTYTDTAIPGWASYMQEHEDKQFLLFFDEMNQAAPDVMSALMPIVLETTIAGIKFKNFMVGAAGNFEYENDSVSELSGPLKSRFKPIIVWETNTESTWKAAFNYLHRRHDAKVGEKIINKFEEVADLFENPREVEQAVLIPMYDAVYGDESNTPDFSIDDYDANFYLNELTAIAREDLTRAEQDKLAKLADYCYKYTRKLELDPEDDERKKRKKDSDMLTDSLKKDIKNGMTRGFLTSGDTNDKRKYGISRENITRVFANDASFDDGTGINAEMVERYVRKLEADGVKFKYETDKEFLDAGLSDPNED